MLFGTVSHLGVTREYNLHPVFRVSMAQGLPGYSTQLLKGNETEEDLQKPWMVSYFNKVTEAVVQTKFFDTEPEAVVEANRLLKGFLGHEKRLKPTFNLDDFVPGDDIGSIYQRHVAMDEPDVV